MHQLYIIKPLIWNDTGGKNWNCKAAHAVDGKTYTLRPQLDRPVWILECHTEVETLPLSYECESFNDGVSFANDLHRASLEAYLDKANIRIEYAS